MIANNADRAETALTCLMFIEKTIEKMCFAILEEYGQMPVLFAGGVMADKLIRKTLKDKYEASFASPEFSSDNASGTAILASKKYRKENNNG